MNQYLDIISFFLQFEIEFILSSISIINISMTHIQLTEVIEYKRIHIQDLSKHRTKAVKKYRSALERLTKSRDEFTHPASSIITGDLVMRTPLNRKSKLYPK